MSIRILSRTLCLGKASYPAGPVAGSVSVAEPVGSKSGDYHDSQNAFSRNGLMHLCHRCHTVNLSTQNHREQSGYKNEKDFQPQKAVLVQKLSRYDYEKHLKPDHSEEQLKHYLGSKGSDYWALLDRHDEYRQKLDSIHEILEKKGLEVKLVKNVTWDYGDSLVDWADVIFTAGGDGTFLHAASKVKGHSIPVIGINTDPIRPSSRKFVEWGIQGDRHWGDREMSRACSVSEGHLCLPKHYSLKTEEAVDKLLDGRFKWKWRQRIRLTMSGKHRGLEPIDLYQQHFVQPEHRYWEFVREHEMHHSIPDEVKEQPSEVLPVLALNEVFIGESLSARVSFHEVSLDGSPRQKQKSSGITVCTGTGSTSWFFNINNISKQSVREILSTAQANKGCCDVKLSDDGILDRVTESFNTALTFDPGDLRMAYCIRDPIQNAVFQVITPRGFCETISVKSRMFDAWVVVDGSVSYSFNDGAVVELVMQDRDALRCVELD